MSYSLAPYPKNAVEVVYNPLKNAPTPFSKKYAVLQIVVVNMIYEALCRLTIRDCVKVLFFATKI